MKKNPIDKAQWFLDQTRLTIMECSPADPMYDVQILFLHKMLDAIDPLIDYTKELEIKLFNVSIKN